HTVPGALEKAIDSVVVGFGTPPRWWRTIRVLHQIAMATALAGLAGLVARPLAAVAGLAGPPGWPVLPAALLGSGVLLGGTLSLVTRLLVRLSAGRARRRADLRLRVAVAEVASDMIVAPVRGVLRDYATARAVLHGEAAPRHG
ncbi:MAG: ABC transporter, partial [Dactylosporangium sp.]|nr:ABC transporter [Dactylosporangium sp.]NNJ62605.1 ABC transporter [Dactylosporangium sp.]